MNGNKSAVAGLGAGAVLCIAGLVAVPMLEAPQRRADREAERHLEIARRLLASYNPEADLSGEMLSELKVRDVDVSLEKSADKIEDPDFQTAYETQRDASVELFHSKGDQIPKGSNAVQMREGVKAHNNLVKENQAVLKEALTAVDAALNVTVGDASTRSHPAANRLRGAIQYESARSTLRGATLTRSGMAPLLTELGSLDQQARALTPQTLMLASSGIDGQLAKVDAEIVARQKDIDAITQECQGLEAQVKDHESRLAQARQAAETQRQAFEDLAAQGMDFAAPDAFDQFQRRHNEHAAQYRQAVRAAAEAEFGVYPKASIDASGDFVQGRLLEGGSPELRTQQLGLTHYRAELERAAETRKVAEATLAELRELRTRMKGTRDALEAEQSQAVAELKALQSRASTLMADLQKAQGDASAAEASAVTSFTQAAQSFAAGLNGAEAILRDAADRSRDVSPEAAVNSSYTKISQSGPSVYHLATEQAEALAGAAWTHQQAYASAKDAGAQIAAGADALALPGSAAAVFEQAAAASADAGRELARKSAELLASTHGKVGGHWTVAAELAGTGYLFVLFGDQHLLPDVVANYRNALDGRQDELAVRPIKERLDYLEKR